MEQNKSRGLLRQRLLNDLAELQQKPYPGITIQVQDHNALQQACLIISPEGEKPLHLTVIFGDDYPLHPPVVTIQSRVSHPNVFNDYICASILNTNEGYTSAYTLKGICIQLLSFFGSDTVEQMHDNSPVNRKEWQREDIDGFGMPIAGLPGYQCKSCGFGRINNGARPTIDREIPMPDADSQVVAAKDASVHLTDLPSEVLLLICDQLDKEALLLAARAWNGFGRVMRQYNIIRTREVQCFTLKKGFNKACLGVGVHVQGRMIQSEFDLVSDQAFFELGVRRAVQALNFEHWLPLPISQTHWLRAKKYGDVDKSLNDIARAAGVKGPLVTVLYTFMNDIAVRLSQEASDALGSWQTVTRRHHGVYGEQQSTLTHASEKAIESYFHLFHLLLCLATERPSIAKDANDTITDFLAGKRDKQRVPNLGHLLVMVLLSSKEVTEELMKAIIKEAITRNVVWMLDARGQNMPELAFLETDAVSEYRLQKTFEAGKISYRLLMFAKLMMRCVTTTSGTTAERKTLADLRDDLFSRHGAPSNGAASALAASVRRIQKVSSFPEFLKAMDITQMPSKPEFTSFLRRTVQESVDKGYSKWALTQEEALVLRERQEPKVGRPEGMWPAHAVRSRFTFFPEERKGGRRR